ncbi:hypothetical protein Tco_0954041 [Tanacetum coccineum]|uniref:Uncharacterized protein n=1 Tax=Tanacetum coccineum TaxID=301880 RepID=A0ABQ5E1N3_9ASTR
MGDLNITLHHDGVFVPNPLKLVLSNAKHIFYCLPYTTLTRSIRELKTYNDMVKFMRIDYENDKQIDLFTEHDGYDVLEYTANDNLVAKNFSDNEETDSESLLVYCGRDTSIGRCASKKTLMKDQEKDKEKDKGKMSEKDKQKGKGKMGEKSMENMKWTKTEVLEQKGLHVQ